LLSVLSGLPLRSSQKVVHDFWLVGIIVNALVRLSPVTSDITNFNVQSFFNILLPPIVLDNGYSMRKVCNMRVDFV